MAEAKTKQTKQSVASFIKDIPDPQTRADCRTIAKLMQEATGAEGKMWGSSIVGFGTYRYKYASGREADWPIIGFSPRKQNLTLYFSLGLDKQADLLKKLGKHSVSKGCLYFKHLFNVDLATLKKLIKVAAKRK
jgi:hypothetical protein